MTTPKVKLRPYLVRAWPTVRPWRRRPEMRHHFWKTRHWVRRTRTAAPRNSSGATEGAAGGGDSGGRVAIASPAAPCGTWSSAGWPGPVSRPLGSQWIGSGVAGALAILRSIPTLYGMVWKTLSLARSPALAVFLCGAAATLSHSLALVFLLLGRVCGGGGSERRNCNTALGRLGSAFIYITQPKTHRVPPMLPYLGLLFSLQSRSLQGHAAATAAFFFLLIYIYSFYSLRCVLEFYAARAFLALLFGPLPGCARLDRLGRLQTPSRRQCLSLAVVCWRGFFACFSFRRCTPAWR